MRDAVMVIVAVPGQKREVEFMDDGTVEVEKFISDGIIYYETVLRELVDWAD